MAILTHSPVWVLRSMRSVAAGRRARCVRACRTVGSAARRRRFPLRTSTASSRASPTRPLAAHTHPDKAASAYRPRRSAPTCACSRRTPARSAPIRVDARGVESCASLVRHRQRIRPEGHGRRLARQATPSATSAKCAPSIDLARRNRTSTASWSATKRSIAATRSCSATRNYSPRKSSRSSSDAKATSDLAGTGRSRKSINVAA